MSKINAGEILKSIEQPHLKSNLPEMAPGDTVKVFARIREGGKERIQAYEGTVIKLQGAGVNRAVVVRRIFQGVGVERTFPVHSPRVDRFEVMRKGAVRRARLYYLRGLQGKATRIK
ncbi:MAG: 50S ribosomal protein L19, partial [Candidatus Sericytochromatia bacterium]|nr:50S ribosomal protein L19 [Candidatus Sericytochromatia bacterium]